VEVIEEALCRLPVPKGTIDLEDFRSRFEAILAGIEPATVPSMAEFEAVSYHENGLPR
jgi:ATP-dependent Zn protease